MTKSNVITVEFRSTKQRVKTLLAIADELDDDPATMRSAEDVYHRALLLDPNCAIAHCNVGVIQFRRGALLSAVASFRDAIRSDADYVEAHYNLGVIEVQCRRPNEAIKHLTKAVALAPDWSDAHYLLADAYEQMGHRKLARRHWQRVIELTSADKSHQWARDALARLREYPEIGRRQ